MRDSAIARTAVYTWNKLNTAVRMLVHNTTVSFEQHTYGYMMVHLHGFCLPIFSSFMVLRVCLNVKVPQKRKHKITRD